MSAISKATSALLLALSFSGCPRDVATPPRPGGPQCTSLRDCNPDAGALCDTPLHACIDERCESDPSVVIPCAR
jgi:hypothetical protein